MYIYIYLLLPIKEFRLVSRTIWKSNDCWNANIYEADKQSQFIIVFFNGRHTPTIIKLGY